MKGALRGHTYYLAIDIGASNGRHILGHIQDGRIHTEEIYRFDHTPVRRGGQLCWDADTLFDEVVNGLRPCRRLDKPPVSLAIDTWGVDFALLNARGERLGACVAYRDERTQGADALVEAKISPAALYARTGIQKHSFNTIYQLAALRRDHPAQLADAARLLMTPEYLNYRLTGRMLSEYTISSTTGLLRARDGDWDAELLDLLGFPRRLFGTLHRPMTTVGGLRDPVKARAGFDCEVTLAPSHDTASAFLAVPAADDGEAVYLSSGTWSLLGIETDAPITTPESLAAGFTNEGGFDGRFRYLKNIMGLWMLQSIRRELPEKLSYDQLAALARQNDAFDTIIDVDDACFFAPDSMLDAIGAYCARHGLTPPRHPGETAQCVYRSLAACYAHTIRTLAHITGRTFTRIHIVGGGSRDTYLNEMTARATGLPVYAGPAEATALGNIVCQMLRNGALTKLSQAREMIRRGLLC